MVRIGYLANSPSFPDDHLFDLPDSAAVNLLAHQIGALLEHPVFRGHSFRIGVAISLCLLGYPAEEIKACGDW